MNRRGFLKTLMSAAVMGAAISTGLGRTEAIKLVSGKLDAGKVASIGQVWTTNELGGYMYSDELSEVMSRALQPVVKFRQFQAVKRGLQA